MKILYAASNRKGAVLQLNRFLASITDKDYNLKIAAYVGPKYLRPVDWNLNALLNFFKPDQISFNSNELEIYYEQIKSFAPDLIISDLEPFTSYVGQELNIPVWQVSPLLLYRALEKKYNLGIYTNYSFLFNRKIYLGQRIKNIIYNSDNNFVYSHFCDLKNPIALKEGYDWIRPYHVIGHASATCKHNLVGVSTSNEKNLIKLLKNHQDAVFFTDFLDENYLGVTLKDMNNFAEYACNLRNCDSFVNQGMADILADAFYNNKFSWIMTDFKDEECIINSIITENLGLGRMVYDSSYKIEPQTIEAHEYNGKVKLLHEKLEDL